jgi:TPP-dependent pyruvate/acetoin dehydrogenase alpha subunit
MQTIKKEVDNAVAQAKQSEIPQPDALWHNIYRDTLGGMSVKGLDSSIKVKL